MTLLSLNKQVKRCGFRCSCGEKQQIKSENGTLSFSVVRKMLTYNFKMLPQLSDTAIQQLIAAYASSKGGFIISSSINHNLLMKIT